MNRPNYPLNIFFILAVVVFVAIGCKNSGAPSVPNAASSNGTASSASNAAVTEAPAPAPAKVDIAGSYAASGTNMDGGGAYKASLVVTPRDDVYQFSWESGVNKYDGVGVVRENTVAVSFTDGEKGKGCGVVLYSIGADGSLDGVTGYWGVNSAETERGTRRSGSDLDGTYDVTGRNVDGTAYKGTLNVEKDGEGYSFRWNTGTSLSGHGIKVGNKAIAGFGGRQCAFVAYEIKPDGTLEGKWGAQGSRLFGTETAVKQ